MAELKGGTTIGGFQALHSGLKESYLGGNLTLAGGLTVGTDVTVTGKTYMGVGSSNGIYGAGGKQILIDHNNGNVTLSATNGALYLGYQTTSAVRLQVNLVGSDGSTKIADAAAKLYYQGNDIDGRYLGISAKAADSDKLDGIDSSGFMRATVDGNGYYALTDPAGSQSNWIRTTTNGILPNTSGGASALGTSGWPFTSIYGNNIYEGGVSLSSKYVKYTDNVLVDDGLITSNTQDWNNLGTGLREVQNGTSNGFNSSYGQPVGAYQWGGLITNQLANTRFQLYTPHTGTDAGVSNLNSVWMRTGWGTDWKPWVRLIDSRGGEVGTLQMAASSLDEGGEIQLKPGTGYSTLSYIDRYKDNVRIWTGNGPTLTIPASGDMLWGGGLNMNGNLTLNSKLAISGDSWLRLNGNGSFTDGIYMGNSLVRTDGYISVGAEYTGESSVAITKTKITFNSSVNYGSDYGFIRYDADNNGYAYWGDSNENSALVIGVTNDPRNVSSDVIALESPAAVIVNAPEFRATGEAYVNGHRVYRHWENITWGTANPSGGQDGDIYIQY